MTNQKLSKMIILAINQIFTNQISNSQFYFLIQLSVLFAVEIYLNSMPFFGIILMCASSALWFHI